MYVNLPPWLSAQAWAVVITECDLYPHTFDRVHYAVIAVIVLGKMGI